LASLRTLSKVNTSGTNGVRISSFFLGERVSHGHTMASVCGRMEPEHYHSICIIFRPHPISTRFTPIIIPMGRWHCHVDSVLCTLEGSAVLQSLWNATVAPLW